MKRDILLEYRGKRSQREMGQLYGVAQQVWARWEQGLAKPNILMMKRLEDDIGCPMEKIFADVFDTKKLLRHKTSAACN